MVFPMMVFFLMLAMLGGLIITLGGSNPRAARQRPIAFAMLFAGIGYCTLALVLYPLAFYLGTATGFALLFFGPFLAGLSGAIAGYRTGLKRRATARQS